MKSLTPLVAAGVFAVALPACGEKPAEKHGAATVAQLTAALFDTEGSENFQKALEKARAGGVPEQALLEARFLDLVDRQDYRGIAALAPELVARQKSFKIEDSQIFGMMEEWQAVVRYSQALAALEEGNHEGFKEHIQEAFWLSPRQAGIFAPHIEQLRLEKAMAKVRVDLKKPFLRQGKGEKASLGGLAKDSPLILLHFWSPWSQECEAFLEDFIATANELARKNVAVVSVLADNTPEIMPDANSYQEAVNNHVGCFWIVDDETRSLSRLLRIPDLPTMVLLDRNGKVLFNGHPSEPKLWAEMKKVVPAIARPALAPDKALEDTPPSP